jgi:VCBS repeat-containing protein
MGRTVAVLALVLALGGSGQALAASRADLKVTKVSAAPASETAGSSFKVSVTVKNAGGRKAKASKLAAYLSLDARRGAGDVRLNGAPKVKALKHGRTDKGGRRFTIPPGAKAGVYRVLVCADAKGAVKERSEGNNCRAAKGSLKIPAVVTPGPGPQAPQPQPLPQPTPPPTPTGTFPQAPDPIDVGSETLDTAHSVTHSSTFPLTTTAADGTKYTLAIPAGALVSAADITMTPVTAIQGMPLGQLIGAVHLEPYGLQLLKAATLTIEPPAEAPIASQTAFLMQEGGDDFHLAPLENTRTLTIPITHFSTPGVAQANDVQRANVAGHAPIRTLAQLEQAIAGWARAARASDLGQPVGDVPDPATLRSDYYEHVVKPELQAAENEDAKVEPAVEDALGWARDFAVLGAEDGGLEAEMWQEIEVVLRNAVDRAYIQCAQGHDLHQIIRLIGFEREAQLLGLDLGEAFPKALACAHFEVDFDALFTTDQVWTSTSGDRTFQENGKWEMAAERVPVDISGLGSGALNWTQFDFHSTDVQRGSSCTLTTTVDGTHSTSYTVQVRLDLDLNSRELPPAGQPLPDPPKQYLVVDPQTPVSPFPETYRSQNSGCSGNGSDFTGDHWKDLLESFHTEPDTPTGARFLLNSTAAGGDLLDAQQIDRERGSGDIRMTHDTETTTFEIFHAPRAP